MTFKNLYICFFCLSILTSCNNQNSKKKVREPSQNEQQTDSKQLAPGEESAFNTSEIIEKLQGTWKEVQYPYRRITFVKKQVKFVEEGTQVKPDFEPFEIAQNCTYNFDSRSVDHPPYCVPQLGTILEPILGAFWTLFRSLGGFFHGFQGGLSD